MKDFIFSLNQKIQIFCNQGFCHPDGPQLSVLFLPLTNSSQSVFHGIETCHRDHGRLRPPVWTVERLEEPEVRHSAHPHQAQRQPGRADGISGISALVDLPACSTSNQLRAVIQAERTAQAQLRTCLI